MSEPPVQKVVMHPPPMDPDQDRVGKVVVDQVEGGSEHGRQEWFRATVVQL